MGLGRPAREGCCRKEMQLSSGVKLRELKCLEVKPKLDKRKANQSSFPTYVKECIGARGVCDTVKVRTRERSRKLSRSRDANTSTAKKKNLHKH